ncbi:MAG: 4Fe-4S cluster-binding domain-containing protein [Victivallales bacterium]|nr:4Fe-4S cluster-binding domain-containing protein [Victivallales bacterium]
MKVAETFKSIQGESSFAGLPCFFIRLSGCNLDCRGCDTEFAKSADSDFFDAEIAELLKSAENSEVGLVEVTGGEPLAQNDTPALCEKLLGSGFIVLLETNGSLPISRISRKVHRIMDCKCPSSGEAESMLSANFAELTPNDEVKFVVADRNDFNYALAMSSEYSLTETGCGILVSPAMPIRGVKPAATPAEIAEWLLESGFPARLQLQLHKILWPRENHGR